MLRFSLPNRSSVRRSDSVDNLLTEEEARHSPALASTTPALGNVVRVEMCGAVEEWPLKYTMPLERWKGGIVFSP